MPRCRLAWTLLFAQLTGLALIVPCAALAQVQINQQFVPQGPSPSQGPVGIVQSNDLPNGQGTVAGAVQAVLLDPALGANTVFIGSPNGGVWSTNNFGAPNGGTIWTPLTDAVDREPGARYHGPIRQNLSAGIGITSNGVWSNGGLSSPAGSGGLRTGLIYSTNAGASCPRSAARRLQVRA
jgi:hypothetical protein